MLKIVVINRGWVIVGRVSTEGNMVVIENAAVLRKWGTSAGLGGSRA